MIDPKHLEALQALMEELQEQMEYGKDDFEERLGRKPSVEIVKMEGGENPEMEAAEESSGMDMDGDEEMGESLEHKMKVFGGEEENEDDRLKKRLMGLRRGM